VNAVGEADKVTEGAAADRLTSVVETARDMILYFDIQLFRKFDEDSTRV
jgi:hypothetical protein